MSVVVGVLKETAAKETRVALVPEIATKLKSLGVRVLIERGAGAAAHFPDALYADAEFSDAAAILGSADVILKVQPPSLTEVAALKKGAVIVGFMQAYARHELVLALKERGITSFAMELVPRIAPSDAVISTASVPGRAAPRIISQAAVARMKAGSVIVDLAAEQGGNCELTKAGETVLQDGVKIVGPLNLPASLPYHASEMYSRNLFNFLKQIGRA